MKCCGGAPGNRDASLFPEGVGGIACGNRALCEADAASAEALWTMPHLRGAAVIVHADGYTFCFIIKTCRLPVKNINLMFFSAMGIAFPATPIFFLRKRNKNRYALIWSAPTKGR